MLAILAWTGVILLPALVTLSVVNAPPPPPTAYPEANPSPFGYTVSLTLFIVPVLFMATWHVLSPKHPLDRKALFGSALTVAVLGSICDVVFGHTFFTFPNEAATLGIRVPSWNFSEMAWARDYLPIEEFGFYIFGGFFMITSYVWADQHWLVDYEADEYHALAKRHPKLVHFSWEIVLAAVAVIAAGTGYKRFFAPSYNDGFPGWLIFLVIAAMLPTMVLFKGVYRFLNWRAFSVSLLLLLLLSLLWEATLAVPYGWWAFRPEQMVGIPIVAWSDMPIEEVFLWIIAAWTAVVLYEAFRVFFHMERTVKDAAFGARRHP